jgi:TRAP-type C4-dicarboxylate transport system permease small subunit
MIVRRIEAVGLSVAMLGMAAVTIANVIARNVTGDNLAAAEELNQFLIVFVCFIGFSYAAGMGRHIRMTALSDALSRDVRRRLMIFISVSTAALLFVLGWFALRYTLSVDRESPVLGVPMHYVYLLAPIGLWMGGLQYILTALSNARGPEVFACFDRVEGHAELEDVDPPHTQGEHEAEA